MNVVTRLFVLVVALFCGLAFAPRDASAETVIRTQAPCRAAGQTYCLRFDVRAPADVKTLDFRTFSFTAPSAGTAQVTFHGSMLCALSTAPFEEVLFTVVDVVTQIVEASSAVPAPDGQGALRLATVIDTTTALGSVVNKSDSFNLASTRVFNFTAAGTRTFRFRMRPLRIDPRTSCFVYNAAFTVVFAP